MLKTIVISGVNGQDGSLLAKECIKRGYHVIGGLETLKANTSNLDALGIKKEMKLLPFDLNNLKNIETLIKSIKPDFFVNFAGMTSVVESYKYPYEFYQTNTQAVSKILEAIRVFSPHTKFFQAGSSEMFGTVENSPQSEMTEFKPNSPYGCSKLCSYLMVKNYRKVFGLNCINGIFYNHESILRSEKFVTKKIVQGFFGISKGSDHCLMLGNLDSKRDWSHAQDFIEGVLLALNYDKPDDFVFASGTSYSIRTFCQMVAEFFGFVIIWQGEGLDELGIDKTTGKVLVKISQEFFRKSEEVPLVGDSTKARKMLGWAPERNLRFLVNEMCEYERGVL